VLTRTLLLSLSLAHAQQQIDIPGPPGSSSFGTTVTALANGDIIVSGSDSVYLYSHAGSLLATMGGGNQGKVLPNGNIVVSGLGSVHLYDPTGAPISTPPSAATCR